MDNQRLVAVLEAVAAAGQPVPLKLQRPGGNSAHDPDAWKDYRDALIDLGSDIDWAFTERALFLDWTSPARSKARYDYLVQLRAAADNLAALLANPPPAASLHSHFPPFATEGNEHLADLPSLAQIAEGARHLATVANAAAGRIEGLSDGKTALLDSEPDGSKGWVTEEGWPIRSGSEAFYARITLAYRDNLAEDADWLPDFRLSRKTGAADPFTVFVVACQEARNEPAKAESVQGEYRRWRRSWGADKAKN